MDPEERLKSALPALRTAQGMLQDIRRGTTDISQAEAIDNLCAKIAEVIHGDEPESDKVMGHGSHRTQRSGAGIQQSQITLISFTHWA